MNPGETMLVVKKPISIVTPCYNEVDNVQPLYDRLRAVFDAAAEYEFEHIFADNASTDGTQEVLRGIAEKDKRVKVILNLRSFGHIRSRRPLVVEREKLSFDE